MALFIMQLIHQEGLCGVASRIEGLGYSFGTESNTQAKWLEAKEKGAGVFKCTTKRSALVKATREGDSKQNVTAGHELVLNAAEDKQQHVHKQYGLSTAQHSKEAVYRLVTCLTHERPLSSLLPWSTKGI